MNATPRHSMCRWLTLAGLGCHASAFGQIAFSPLPVLSGNAASTRAVDSSGAVAMGQSSPSLPGIAVRWESSGQPQFLGLLPGGTTSMALAGSQGGLVIVGEAENAVGSSRAFRWTIGEGITDLGVLDNGTDSFAYGVSADGSIIVGGSDSAVGLRAFRWTLATGMQSLGALPGGGSSASAVTPDGSVIVGTASTSAGNRAFRWTAAAGMEDLGALPNGTLSSSTALGISADGSTIVGSSALSGIQQAVRWTAATPGPQVIPAPIAGHSQARSASSDGSMILGLTVPGSALPVPFVWTEQSGTRSLLDFLTSGGADLSGWILGEATGLTPDGRVIVGNGWYQNHPRAWIARLPAPCVANCDNSTTIPVLTANDFQCFLNQYAAGDARANCDGSTAAPVLTANDFQCFLNTFASGCP